MGEYFRYLPLMFTGRTINSKKALGGGVSQEEKQWLYSNDELAFDKVGHLFQRMPSEVGFIFKAMHLVATHHMRAGGGRRDRFMSYSYSCIEASNEGKSVLAKTVQSSLWRMRIAAFETAFPVFKAVYGFTEFDLPDSPANGTSDNEFQLGVPILMKK